MEKEEQKNVCSQLSQCCLRVIKGSRHDLHLEEDASFELYLMGTLELIKGDSHNP